MLPQELRRAGAVPERWTPRNEGGQRDRRGTDAAEETVSRWLARARRRDRRFRARPKSGRPPQLSADQKRLIPEFLWHGPEAYGFRGEVWTCARVARVIAEEFGILPQGPCRPVA